MPFFCRQEGNLDSGSVYWVCGMAIQWFPGHMNRARREALNTMKACDVIVEVVDARAPVASSNPLLGQWCREHPRPCLKILNKTDLADPEVTRAWLGYFTVTLGGNAMALSAKKPGQTSGVLTYCQQLAPQRHSMSKPLRILIVGIPNVGKSTLINSLMRRVLARVGDEPAVTKRQDRYHLNEHMILTDSPGLLWPKIEDPLVGLKLASVHAIGPKALIEEEIGEFLAGTLGERYSNLLRARYGMEVEGVDGSGILEVIAKKRGCIRKGQGGEWDREKAAAILLSEFRKGTLGQVSLERPEKCESP